MIEKKPLNEPLLPPGVDDTSSPDPQVVKARALADPRAQAHHLPEPADLR